MPTHYAGTEAERRAVTAFIALVRAAESVLARLNRRRGEGSPTLSQFMVMDALYFLGPLGQRALGEKILKTSGNVTTVVDNLERAGCVRRERGTEDRRTVTVHLTPKGRLLMDRLVPERMDAIAGEMAVLTPEEHEALRRLCRALGRGERARP